MPQPLPASVTDVRQLIPLWNTNFRGIRPPWDERLNSDLQAKFERVARKDGRLRTLGEWRRLFWRVRSSPFLMGQRPLPGGRLPVLTPEWLLSDGRKDGGPTFATRVETGRYDPEPAVRQGWEGGRREKRAEHMDAHGRSWGPHRCLVGCSLPGCHLEAAAGYTEESGVMVPEGALCAGHAESFEAWRQEPHETAAQLAVLVDRWWQAGAPAASTAAQTDPTTCTACGDPGDGASFDGVRLNYQCGCAGAWQQQLARGQHFSEVGEWATARRREQAA